MRPAYLRHESTLMRRARQADLAAHQMRTADLFALCIGYALLVGVMLAGLVTLGVALDDWANGRTVDVLAQISTLIARLD